MRQIQRIFFLYAVLNTVVAWADGDAPGYQHFLPGTPPGPSFAAYTQVEERFSDYQIAYTPWERFTAAIHAIRSQWPKQLELHYGFVQANVRALDFGAAEGAAPWRVAVQPLAGLGMANKLNGINRLAYIAGLQAEFETPRIYVETRGQTLGARDFAQKTMVSARGGFTPYVAQPDALQPWFLMQAWYESQRETEVMWGPVLRLRMRNIAGEVYGTFKGTLGMAISFWL